MIEVKQLSKNYGKTEAVKGLSFTIEKGSVYGFVGPNGAGKTTTLRILATLLAPTSGTASVKGYRIDREPHKVRQVIGYMPDFFGVYDDLKVHEYLDFFAASYGIPPRERKAIQKDLLELVDLSHKWDAYVDTLSRGMKQRLCLARALIHDPDVLLLDEPASGLDPRARIEIRELIKELHAMGKTIIVSSHILSELAEVCTDIGIIENGELIYSGRIEEAMLHMKGGIVLSITVLDQADRAEEVLRRHPRVGKIIREGNSFEVNFTGDEHEQAELLAALIQGSIKVVEFSRGNGSLEDIFLNLTKGVVS